MSGYKLSSFILCVSVTLILSLNISAGASGIPKVSTETTDAWGVRTTTVNTPSGKLTINMPPDAALGDTISGTVVAEPAGETVERRQANMDTLEGYVFDIPEIPDKVVVSEPEEAPGKEPESKKVVTWEIPATVSGEIVDLVLRDPKGNEVTKTDFPVSPPPAYTPPAKPQAGDYNLPTIGQAGRPVEMTGPFDGELVNTEVKIGGSQTGILTQSPRKTVVESPRDVIGLTDIELTDGDVTVKGQYRSVALKLSADKLELKKGERTTLTVQVLGLQGLKEEIPISLENKSPTVVSMEGGESQTVTVHPEEVGPEGIYTISKTLTGIQTGPFSISARISPEYMLVPLVTMAGDEIDKDDKCDCKDMKVELESKSKTRRYQEKLKNGDTRIILKIPYKFKTKCKGDITAKCDAEIKVEALRKNWKGPEPVSEEVHNGEAKKVTFFRKPAKGINIENIDCGRACPKRPSWSEWESGLLYYEALFEKLDQKIGGFSNDKLKITLTPEKCEKGRKGNKEYNIYGCECNKITLVFPGVKKSRGDYYLVVDEGSISRRKPGVQLVIPYIYNTQCTGHSSAKCNAEVQVDGKPIKWEVENVEKRGRGYKTTGEEINSAKIKPASIECTGECDKRGKPGKWNPNDIKQLRIKIDVPQGKIKAKDIERHSGELELTFTPKYCDKVEIRDKDGKVIEKITFKADIKSSKWKELVGD